MNFTLSEEQLMIRQAARDFAQQELLPNVIERDTLMKYPTKPIRQMGELGFLGMLVDPEYGGMGMDTISYVLAIEEISKVEAACSVIMSVHNSLICKGLERFGSETQKANFLPQFTSGEVIGCFCLSEPEAGSNASNLKTTAEDKGDHYVLNGTKVWITSGGTAGVHYVMAQSDASKGSRGINCLIVEADREGVVIGAKEDKMGIRASDTHTIMYNSVKVPKENRIGGEGFGYKFALSNLADGRIGIAAQALGIAGGAYELALNYAKERKTFGKPIYQHQGVGFKLATMATEIEAARMMVYRAAWLRDNGMDYSMAASMAKLKASEVAMQVTTEAVQIHGGYGYVKEYHVERLMRDAKITQIYEGTSEIQKIVISRDIVKHSPYIPI